MSQNFTTNSICQVPQVTSPYLLDVKFVTKLAANRLDQTTYTFAKPQLLWTKLSRLAILGWHRKLKSFRLKKFGFEWLREISSVSQKKTPVIAGQFPNHVDVVDVGGGQVKGLDHADRVDLHMNDQRQSFLPSGDS